MSTAQFIVTAKRTNGETMFLCEHWANGANMVPYAQSLASRFNSKLKAAPAMVKAMRHWAGLKTWRVEKLQPGL
jgi:hypothetical protein